MVAVRREPPLDQQGANAVSLGYSPTIVAGQRARNRRCIFGTLGLHPDPCPCSGKLTMHHVRHRCEGGTRHRLNLVPVCERHQRFIHSRDAWGDEHFGHLSRDWKLALSRRNVVIALDRRLGAGQVPDQARWAPGLAPSSRS